MKMHKNVDPKSVYEMPWVIEAVHLDPQGVCLSNRKVMIQCHIQHRIFASIILSLQG